MDERRIIGGLKVEADHCGGFSGYGEGESETKRPRKAALTGVWILMSCRVPSNIDHGILTVPPARQQPADSLLLSSSELLLEDCCLSHPDHTMSLIMENLLYLCILPNMAARREFHIKFQHKVSLYCRYGREEGGVVRGLGSSSD